MPLFSSTLIPLLSLALALALILAATHAADAARLRRRCRWLAVQLDHTRRALEALQGRP